MLIILHRYITNNCSSSESITNFLVFNEIIIGGASRERIWRESNTNWKMTYTGFQTPPSASPRTQMFLRQHRCLVGKFYRIWKHPSWCLRFLREAFGYTDERLIFPTWWPAAWNKPFLAHGRSSSNGNLDLLSSRNLFTSCIPFFHLMNDNLPKINYYISYLVVHPNRQNA